MEKTPSRSLTRKTRATDGAPSGIPPHLIDKPRGDVDKLSREDISRCIGIWAQMYRLSDDETKMPEGMQDLCTSSRTSIGRNPASLKRFD